MTVYFESPDIYVILTKDTEQYAASPSNPVFDYLYLYASENWEKEMNGTYNCSYQDPSLSRKFNRPKSDEGLSYRSPLFTELFHRQEKLLEKHFI